MTETLREIGQTIREHPWHALLAVALVAVAVALFAYTWPVAMLAGTSAEMSMMYSGGVLAMWSWSAILVLLAGFTYSSADQETHGAY